MWGMSYPAADFTSVQLSAGPAAVSAGKSISCNPASGQVMCILSGLNATMPDGVVAVATFSIAANANAHVSALTFVGGMGAAANSTAVPMSLSNATISIVTSLPSTVTPTSISMYAFQSQLFTANAAVTWSISPAVGSITAAGVYTAPSLIPAGQTITVRATGVADPSISATAAVSLTPITVTASPALVTLSSGQNQQFTAVVTDSPNPGVTWSRSPAVGSISASGMYSAPASISSGQDITITATSVADPTKSATAIARLSTSSNTQVAAPTFSPAGGTYTGSVSVTLSTATSGATIGYTLDGSTPTTSSPIASGPITLTASGWLRAGAFKTGLTSSSGVEYFYTILAGGGTVATPTFSPAGGTYTGSVSVTISTATSGATIRYTLDGSTPTTSSPIASGPVTLIASGWLRAVAFKTGMTPSTAVEYSYTILVAGGTVATPTFSPAGGSYSGSVSVTISTATSGATIRYTLDGSTPTTSSPIASGPVTLRASSWLRANAFKTGMTTSAGVESFYTIF